MITPAVVVMVSDGRPGPWRGNLASRSAADGKPRVER